jgi:predicted helicase
VALYRPYYKSYQYFDSQLNHRTYQMPRFFPTPEHDNLVICLNGIGVSKEFAPLIVDVVPDVQIQPNGQCFPMYTDEKVDAETGASLFGHAVYGESVYGSAHFTDPQQPIINGYRRHDNINDQALALFHKTYGSELSPLYQLND